MKKTKNYKNQILDSIKINYFEMIKEYDEKSKSDFWKKKFNKAKLEKFNLKYFRKKNIWGYSLNQGMEDDKNFYDTMISLIRVLNETNISDIKNLIELEVGKPKYYNFGDIKANYHEFFTIKQLNRISKYLKNDHKVVCEIGGGFGSLASKIKKRFKNKNIILIDLPESLILQTFYLYSLFPDCNFCLFNDFNKLNIAEIKSNNYDFILIPPWSKNKLIGNISIDFFINSHSFMEMDKSAISDYFKLIHKTLRINGVFYSANKRSKKINKTEIKFSEYPYDKYWKVLNYENIRTKYETGYMHPNMLELVTERDHNEKKEVQDVLANIGKESPSKLEKNYKHYLKRFFRNIADFIMFFFPKRILFKLFKIYY